MDILDKIDAFLSEAVVDKPITLYKENLSWPAQSPLSAIYYQLTGTPRDIAAYLDLNRDLNTGAAIVRAYNSESKKFNADKLKNRREHGYSMDLFTTLLTPRQIKFNLGSPTKTYAENGVEIKEYYFKNAPEEAKSKLM